MSAYETEGGSASERRGLRDRLSSQAEDTNGRLADVLLETQVINSARPRAFGARELVSQAQESALEALNLPTASSIDKLARRLRSISQRLDDIEDAVERLDRRLETLEDQSRAPLGMSDRLERVDLRLDDLARDVGALRRELAPVETVPAAQTRATVPEG
jgi:chromosome segregation ATPase